MTMMDTNFLPKVSEDVLKHFFNALYFKRGQQLYLKGASKIDHVLPISDEMVLVAARTKGTIENEYDQDLVIEIEHQQVVGVRGGCSCPVGENCKHVISACLTLFKGVDESSHKSFDRFYLQGALERVYRLLPEVYTENQPHYDHLFVLSSDKVEADPLGVVHNISYHDFKVIERGLTQRGRERKPKVIQPYLFERHAFHHHEALPQNAFLGENVEMLAPYGSRGLLAVQYKFLALKNLIDFKRFYIDSHTTPAQWLNEPVSVPLEVNLEAERPFYCQIPEGCLLLMTQPALLVDVEQNCVRQANLPVIAPVFSEAIRFESNHLDMVDGFYQVLKEAQQLLPQTPSIALPNIQALEMETIAPEPVAVIEQFHHTNHQFQLGFQYDQWIVEGGSESPFRAVDREGHRFLVHTDTEKEAALLAQLPSYLHRLAMHSGSQIWGLSNFVESNPAQWYQFIYEVVPKLQAQGWIVRLDEADYPEPMVVDKIELEARTVNQGAVIDFKAKQGGKSLPAMEALTQIIEQYDPANLPEKIFVSDPVSESVMLFEREQVQPILETLLQLGMREASDKHLRVEPFEAHLITGLDNQKIQWKGSKAVLKLANKLKDFKGIQAVKPPKSFKATLRDYQQYGLNWLNFLYEHQFNGILADDMGLGKTLQTLCWLLLLKQQKRLKSPALIVVPTSLIGNWRSEAAKFAPDLKLLVLQGKERFSLFEQIPQVDVVLTSYPLIAKDRETLAKQPFHVLILDEAQKIKNPKTKLYQALQDLQSEHRLCLSGTPIENHLGELWSLFNFLMPGFLGNLPQFKKRYQTPIEKQHDVSVQAALNQRIAPFILRRTKSEVVTELPDKTEIIKVTEFDSAQAKLYEGVRLTMEKKVREAVAKKGLNQSQIMILDALLKLRQVCCDPSLVKLDTAKKVKSSAKMELLMELLPELIEAGHKIILFSQFASMLKIIGETLEQHKIRYSKLTGQTRHREEVINQFKNGEVDVFLISLKAGGVGLNLTEADTIIHYDPWWNPAVEEQATDRAYRIGQDKEVFVYKLIVANTIEEKILQLQEQKKSLQQQILKSDEAGKLEKLTGEALLNLLTEPS